MKRDQIAIISLSVGSVFLALLFSLYVRNENRQIAEQPASQTVLQASQTPQASPTVSQTAIDPKELEFSLPDLATYRSQALAGENHEGAGLPPVIHEFSQRMGTLMEKASASPAFAAALFDRLQDCATKPENPLPQIRTICAVNAMRLGDFHPSTLSEKAKSFRSSLSPELKQAVEAMGY